MAWYFVMIIHLEKRKRRKRGGRGWAEEEEKEKGWLPDATHPWRSLESRFEYTIVNQGLRIS